MRIRAQAPVRVRARTLAHLRAPAHYRTSANARAHARTDVPGRTTTYEHTRARAPVPLRACALAHYRTSANAHTRAHAHAHARAPTCQGTRARENTSTRADHAHLHTCALQGYIEGQMRAGRCPLQASAAKRSTVSTIMRATCARDACKGSARGWARGTSLRHEPALNTRPPC
eukprot:1937660-Alexandrium_andersonii.AAC.1